MTSGLADLGLVEKDSRKITEIGQKILDISNSGDFKSDNVFGIDKDSYIYLLQFLKYQISIEREIAKPFVYSLFLLCKLDKLTRDEFTYLLPICTTKSDVMSVYGTIKAGGTKKDIDLALLKKMMRMSNYQEALSYFLKVSAVTEDVIGEIGMNRKSGKYDRAIFPLYDALHDFWLHKTESYGARTSYVDRVVNSWMGINANQKGSWGQYLSISKTKNIRTELFLDQFTKLPLFEADNEREFRSNFFKTWRLFKWKSTLEDYYDLNKRPLLLSDVIVYSHETFSLTETAKLYFSDVIDQMFADPVISDNDYESRLCKWKNIDQIYPECVKTKNDIANAISHKFGKRLNGEELDSYLAEVRNNEFKELIRTHFTKDLLIKLLDAFKKRDDDFIKREVSDMSSPSTSFEYILGIIWYEISGEEGNIEDCFNLGLDASLMPVRHAVGNTPDLQFSYAKLEGMYPSHTMLMEVTLAENSGQRHMEWEPVSRHLENQLAGSRSRGDYALFVSSQQHAPTIKSFRAMKNYEAGEDGSGLFLKIIPLDCDLMKKVLEKEMTYRELYQLFETAFQSNKYNMVWYRDFIVGKLN